MDRAESLGQVTESRPIMISGVYRSGTTFLTAMLGAHPTIRAASSTVKFLRFCVGRYGDMDVRGNRHELVKDTDARIRKRWGLSLDVDGIVARSDREARPSYALMYELIMRDLLCAGASLDVRWAEKLAVQWEDIDRFLEMFPNGKAIHIFRDPRDVAVSYKLMTFEPGCTYLDAAFNFRGAAECIEGLVAKFPERVLVVRAEDVAAEPEANARRICAFLDTEYSPAMVDARSLRADGEDWASNTSFGKTYRALPDAKPRWPENLSRAEVMFIEMICQPYFSRLNYVTSGFLPSAEEWLEMHGFISDSFLSERFSRWLSTGRGAQGYRTDPYEYEMKLVFPERYGATSEAGAT